jgi:hypothetical protein
MNRTRIAVAGVAALAAAAPAVAFTTASAAPASHKITFVSHPLKDSQIGNHDMETSRDVQHGKPVGFDTTNCAFSPPRSLVCTAVVARTAGMLYAKFNFNPNAGTTSGGRITGGSGAYKGATGTLSAKQTGKNSTTVTIKYHTS